jgi:DNA repair exonuclease SbcCD ATPase subunit
MWNPLRWLKSGPSTAKSGTSAETDPRAQERKKRAKTAEELLQEYTRTYDALMARREELRMKIRGSQKRLGGGMHGNNHETIDRIQLDVAEKEIAEIDEILVKLGPDIETAREAQRVIMEDSAAQSKRSWDMLQHEVDREADRILLEEVLEGGLQKDLIKLADVESSVRESMEARSRYLEEMSHIRRPDATEKDVDILHLAGELVVDQIVDFGDLRRELIGRFELYSLKKRDSYRLPPILPM